MHIVLFVRVLKRNLIVL